MKKIIERAMQIVALRALDPKDHSNCFAMISYESGKLQRELVTHISLILSNSVEEQKVIKKKIILE